MSKSTKPTALLFLLELDDSIFQHIGIATIFAVEVHSILLSNPDDLV